MSDAVIMLKKEKLFTVTGMMSLPNLIKIIMHLGSDTVPAH